ncbi:hypothetical protein B296_00046575 [Ensete ventricosum]|uniref:HTH La-type RNA-binding domain-containing protein n=1 Tax=Ensete ventricosum TaxID=4639 RepID=A0A426Z3D3_ENSVE|nr:hypothetical protein B296_00046575 [Ensete ventricosum]
MTHQMGVPVSSLTSTRRSSSPGCSCKPCRRPCRAASTLTTSLSSTVDAAARRWGRGGSTLRSKNPFTSSRISTESDTNLVANDFLMKIMNKDPEGFVPMSVVASWKKIKSLGANHHMLIKALRTSTKLVSSLPAFSMLTPPRLMTTTTASAIMFAIEHSHSALQALSDDCKKIRRKQLFTERDKEELQVK